MLLGKELDDYMVLYVKHLHSSGAVVNTAIVMAASLEWCSFVTAIFIYKRRSNIYYNSLGSHYYQECIL